MAERVVFVPGKENGGHDNVFSPIRSEVFRYELLTRPYNLPVEVETELTENQRSLLKQLERAARRAAELYSIQESPDARKPFYPPKVTKREIFEAAESNPDLLSPYTFVSRTQVGDLVAIPMHEIYRERLRSLGIIGLLKDAANKAGKGRERDQLLQAYLRAKANSFETGDYEAPERIWLTREDEPFIDAVFGLYDPYNDNFLGRKYSWQAWAGVLDRQLTHDSQWFLNSFLGWWQAQTGREVPKIKVRVDHTKILTGQAVKYDWVGNSLPCQPEWRNRYGSKFTIFEPVFEDKFKHRKLLAFREFIDPEKVQGIQDRAVRLAAMRKIVGHETAHSLLPGVNIQQRLQQETAWVKELYCDLLALIGYRNVKGLSLRESEIAMTMAFSDGFLDFEDRKKRPEYHRSSTIITKYPIHHGSLRLLDGRFTWYETPAVFKDLTDLLSETQDILLDGTLKDAQKLRERYFDPTIYRYLSFKETYPQPEEINPSSNPVITP